MRRRPPTLPQADRAPGGDHVWRVARGSVSGNVKATETGGGWVGAGYSEDRDLQPGSEKRRFPSVLKASPRLLYGFEVQKDPLSRSGICSSTDQPAIQAKQVQAQILRHLAQPQTGLFFSNGCPLAVGIIRKLRLWGGQVGGHNPGEESGYRGAERRESHLQDILHLKCWGKGRIVFLV